MLVLFLDTKIGWVLTILRTFLMGPSGALFEAIIGWYSRRSFLTGVRYLDQKDSEVEGVWR